MNDTERIRLAAQVNRAATAHLAGDFAIVEEVYDQMCADGRPSLAAYLLDRLIALSIHRAGLSVITVYVIETD